MNTQMHRNLAVIHFLGVTLSLDLSLRHPDGFLLRWYENGEHKELFFSLEAPNIHHAARPLLNLKWTVGRVEMEAQRHEKDGWVVERLLVVCRRHINFKDDEYDVVGSWERCAPADEPAIITRDLAPITSA